MMALLRTRLAPIAGQWSEQCPGGRKARWSNPSARESCVLSPAVSINKFPATSARPAARRNEQTCCEKRERSILRRLSGDLPRRARPVNQNENAAVRALAIHWQCSGPQPPPPESRTAPSEDTA